MITNQDLINLRELIQDDILTTLDDLADWLGSNELAEKLKNRICQNVVDQINPLIERNTKEGKIFP